MKESKPPERERCFCGRGFIIGEGNPLCSFCFNEKVKKQAEIAQEKIKLIPARYSEAKLSDLDDNVKNAYGELSLDMGLYLHGPPGSGKTYAMCAIMAELIGEGKSIKRVTYEYLCLEIRDTFKPKATKTELDVLKFYVKPDVLFIEDVGTTTRDEESNFSRRTFMAILDKRVEQCKRTFVTSNKDIIQIAKSFDEAIASRLAMACEVIKLSGKDRRLK